MPFVEIPGRGALAEIALDRFFGEAIRHVIHHQSQIGVSVGDEWIEARFEQLPPVVQGARVIAEHEIIRVVAAVVRELLVLPSAKEPHHAQAIGKRDFHRIRPLLVGEIGLEHPIRDLAQAVTLFEQRPEHCRVAVKAVHLAERLHVGCHRRPGNQDPGNNRFHRSFLTHGIVLRASDHADRDEPSGTRDFSD